MRANPVPHISAVVLVAQGTVMDTYTSRPDPLLVVYQFKVKAWIVDVALPKVVTLGGKALNVRWKFP